MSTEHCQIITVTLRAIALLLIPLGYSIFPALAARAEETKDVDFSTKFTSEFKPKTADFYYNGRAVGRGREGFAKIVDAIRELPARTSVVWGPNYGRDGTGSGSDEPCVPLWLYPDIWKKLESAVKEKRLFLSSAYPGPWLRRVPGDHRGDIALAVDAEDKADVKLFDAVLDWQIGPSLSKEKGSKVFFDPFVDGVRKHVFSVNGTDVDEYGLDLFLGRLNQNASLLIRVTSDDASNPSDLAAGILYIWGRRMREPIRLGNLKAKLVLSRQLGAALQLLLNKPRLAIDWSNFHGPETPHEGVLYFGNGQYLGHGHNGFEKLLAAIDQLPEGADVTLPQHHLAGRFAVESMDWEELKARNEDLAKLIPFEASRADFDTRIGMRRSNLSFTKKGVLDKNLRTVLDWNGGDRFGEAFVSIGRIVHYNEYKRPALVMRLGWTDYDANERPAPWHRSKRRVESEAVYTINEMPVGQGVDGFAKAMDRLAMLKANSVVQVRVCIRTKPPFICPITFQGHRHFERTGFEPYVGMFPWLIDVARRHKLQIEWIPDERESCQDCSLNK